MQPSIIIVGGGGFSVEVVSYLLDLPSPPPIKGILDFEAPRTDYPIDIPWLGNEREHQFRSDEQFVICVGEPALRGKILLMITNGGGRLYTLVHPTAYVSPTAVIEEGAIICPFAFVGPRAHVHTNAVANVRATIGHHASLGAHAVLSPHANLNGFSVAEEGCFLGTGAIIAPQARLGRYSKLAAASVLTSEAPPGSLILGNPGKGRIMFKVP